MTITEKDKAKAKELAAQLQGMAVWLTSLGSSTEPGEVGCVCVKDGSFCGKNFIDPGLICTRAKGHEGPCVSCDGFRHDITGALEREQESIDLEENNPDVCPEWWRELGHLEVIEAGDVFKHPVHGWKPTGCAGEEHEARAMKGPESKPLAHLPHYRLRPWRDMEVGEVIQDGDEFLLGGEAWWPSRDAGIKVGEHLHGHRYRTRRPKPEQYGGYVPPKCLASEPEKVEPPKEPELCLPDGTDISNWPVIEVGEMVYGGDVIMHPEYTNGVWVESGAVDVSFRASTHPYKRPAGVKYEYRRRVLPCRHCGGKAYDKYWYCSDCGCRGPLYDENAVKWNEQNRKSVERSEKEGV